MRGTSKQQRKSKKLIYVEFYFGNFSSGREDVGYERFSMKSIPLTQRSLAARTLRRLASVVLPLQYGLHCFYDERRSQPVLFHELVRRGRFRISVLNRFHDAVQQLNGLERGGCS